MSKRVDIYFLNDIKEAMQRIENYIGDMDYQHFLKDLKTQDAVLRNLEIIGEAVKNVSYEMKREYSDIDWKSIAGMRDKIIHFYFGVNWDIVWSAVKEKVPEFKLKIEKILEEMEGRKG